MAKAKNSKKSNKMWGGRFDARPSDIMQQINVSIDVDSRLWPQDIALSKAHAEMLGRQKILSKKDADAIVSGLGKIEKELQNGTFPFRAEFEDIHMNIEARLRELIGDAAGRLHTARSRNDQVATSFRMWVRDAARDLISEIESFQATIKKLSQKHAKHIMPGYTHLQPAQPVTLGRHLDAYWHMLNRDKTRLEDCAKRLNKCPLGSAALAGTPFPIDREFTAKKLGFDRPMQNTMDAVSARDFANEFLFACAQCGLHLSRLAEEIIIWSTPSFGFVSLSDQWSTGSSIMPQKKNPDSAELVRGKTGRLAGNLISMMTIMKGLPLTYNRDMQEDKPPVFDSYDTIKLCLQVMNGAIGSAKFNTAKMLQDSEDGYTTATALADWLVMELGLPFRDAHHITGTIVKMAEKKGCKLSELALKDMQSVERRITKDIFRVLKI